MTMSIPQWYRDHMQPACEFIASLKPFPFDQPKDISSFIALHQNDYLRLGNHPAVVKARSEANNATREDTFISSIYGGDSDECEQFRSEIARVMKAGDAMLITSGWAANVGLLESITPLFKPVYIDNYAHASLFDGIKLSVGKKVLVNHNDPEHLRERIAKSGPGIVVIDAVYSTDGSIGDIERYVEICEENDCIMVLDEAHSFGLFGNGGGLAVELGLEDRIHFRTVSLNKALGGHGGLIAGDAEAMRLVRARCRSVIFSSATSSVSAAGHLAALNVLTTQTERAQRCMDSAQQLRERLNAHGIDTGDSVCQIVSIVFDSEAATCEFYERLRNDKILTSVFLYPATPKGMGLVRYSVHSEVQQWELDKTVECSVRAMREMGLLDSEPSPAAQDLH
ncbi:MAG: quorum-sensing autoinducer CAI-1 synthase [Wenzhouxiangellaceae bacterium]